MRGRHIGGVVLSLVIACDSPSPPTPTPDTPTSTEKEAPKPAPKETAQPKQPAPSRCEALKADNSMAILRAVSGDVLVLKYTPTFTDAADVANQALKLGATTAAPTVVLPGAAYGKKGMLERVFTGMETPTLEALKPHLVSGSLPKPKRGNEVLLSQQDARDAGVAVGDTLKIAFNEPFPAPGTTGPPTVTKPVTARLAGILRVDELYGVHRQGIWMTRVDLVAAQPNDTTSVAISLPQGTDAAAWKKKLEDAIGLGTYHVMTQEELNPVLMRGQQDELALCSRPAPAAQAARDNRLPLPTCADQPLFGTLANVSKTEVGDVTALSTLGPPAALQAHVASAKADIDRTTFSVSVEAHLYNQATTTLLELQGVEKIDALGLTAVDGDLAHVSDAGGIAIDRITAAHLGVRAGSPIALSIRPLKSFGSSADGAPDYGPWAHVEAKVAAVFDVHLYSMRIGGVFANIHYVASLHPDVSDGDVNVARIWTKPGRAASVFGDLSHSAQLQVAHTAEEIDRTTATSSALLGAFCPSP